MKRGTRKSLAVLTGIILMAGSCLGIAQGVRAGAAQILYRLAKTDPSPDSDLELAAVTAARAYRLYPHNYYYSIWLAERAFYQRFDPFTGKVRPERVEIAQRWCELGLRQNYYDRQLRALKARLLARRSAAEAADYWAEYVNWDFWDPHHHQMLVEFRALAGDYDQAIEELEWARHSPECGEEARTRLRQIIAAESHPPAVVPSTNPPDSPPAP